MSIRSVILLGSTGSVGTQAVDVVLAHPRSFAVTGLAAGRNIALAARQAIRLGAGTLAVAGVEDPAEVRAALAEAAAELSLPDTILEILVGTGALDALAARPADLVLNAVTGAIGLTATLAALNAGTDVALANKESLIVGGRLVLDAAAGSGARLIPVDSEHSAIAQALRGGRGDEVDRLILTASGGPLRGRSRAELETVTPAEALAHPTWDMGLVITTNSATLVNKGLEVIEAHLLFGIDFDRIDVVVHPQSLIHSMVQFADGSTLAQISDPDMRLPIALALSWPDRTTAAVPPHAWDAAQTWTFEPVDHDAFPALGLAYEAGRAGGTTPAVYNAANEVLVEAFHAGRIAFPGIGEHLAAVVGAHEPAGELTLDAVLAADAWARSRAGELVAGGRS